MNDEATMSNEKQSLEITFPSHIRKRIRLLAEATGLTEEKLVETVAAMMVQFLQVADPVPGTCPAEPGQPAADLLML